MSWLEGLESKAYIYIVLILGNRFKIVIIPGNIEILHSGKFD